jgi:hypothetical protein
MDIDEWARNEIELAKKQEKKNAPDDCDYGCACYDSAFKAFQSLCEDGHSEMSIRITKSILDRLIDNKPLTPIYDDEEEWNSLDYFNEKNVDIKKYQCKRMSSLFKTVYSDGSIEYDDVDYCFAKDANNKNGRNCSYHSGLVDKVIKEICPITMPYIPKSPIEVITEDFCSNNKNVGEYDTVGIYYAIIDKNKVNINRYFSESDSKSNKNYCGYWVEITEKEFKERKEKRGNK